MDQWIRFSGIIGLVVFCFGFLAGLVLQDFQSPFLVTHLILGMALLLTWVFGYGARNLGEASQALKGRTARYGYNAALYTAVFIGLLGVANYFAGRFDKRWDLTDEGAFSLSPQSITILESLKQPLLIVAFKGNAQVDELGLSDLFKLYAHANPTKVKAEMVDPRSKPHLIEQYKMTNPNKIYIEYGTGETKQVSRINEVSEQEITNAILKLARGAAKKVYYVQGHDEPDIADASPEGLKSFATSISDEHYTLTPIILAQSATIPEDAAAVILISPKKPLLQEEKSALKDYAEKGGRLLMFTDPRTTSDVKEIAGSFGINVGDDVVIDQVQRLFSAPELGAQPMLQDYNPHAITKGLSKRQPTIFNIASTVRSSSPSGAGSSVTELAKTGSTAWGEVDLTRVFDQANAEAVFDPKTDVPGPVSLAAAYEKKLEAPKSENSGASDDFVKQTRVVVFGDSDFISNANITVFANRDFVLRALNWTVGQEGGVSLPPKQRRGSAEPIPRVVFLQLLAWGFVVPELILLSGLFIWWRRKTVAV